MNIGLYKPLKKVFFHDDSDDNAAWSYEVANIAKIFSENGHSVYMLSDNDLTGDDFALIKSVSLETVIETGLQLDRVILFSGTFSEDKYGENVISMLKSITNRLDFMLTDLRLVPSNPDAYNMFTKIYTQATKPLAGIPTDKQVYGGVAEFLAYGHEWKPFAESMKHKNVNFYFGGTERGRLDDFIEYVWRPEHMITTKTKFFGKENRVTRKEYKTLLDATKYSVVIADVEYNENHFITPRPYEYFMHDIVAFIDNKFDRDGHIIALDSYLRVNNYKEMYEKMKYLDENPEELEQLLLWQRMKVQDSHISGEYVYNILKD